MNKMDVATKIAEITARGIAYAMAHATEIEAENKRLGIESNDKITQILLDAKTATKRNWRVYESFKSRISSVATSCNQYEDALRNLCTILGL